MSDKQYPRNFLRSAQDASLAYMSNRNHRDSCNNPRSVPRRMGRRSANLARISVRPVVKLPSSLPHSKHAALPWPLRAAMPLAALASEAQRGSRQAQLELGIRFEEGRGVEGLCQGGEPLRRDDLGLFAAGGQWDEGASHCGEYGAGVVWLRRGVGWRRWSECNQFLEPHRDHAVNNRAGFLCPVSVASAKAVYWMVHFCSRWCDFVSGGQRNCC